MCEPQSCSCEWAEIDVAQGNELAEQCLGFIVLAHEAHQQRSERVRDVQSVSVRLTQCCLSTLEREAVKAGSRSKFLLCLQQSREGVGREQRVWMCYPQRCPSSFKRAAAMKFRLVVTKVVRSRSQRSTDTQKWKQQFKYF